MQGSVQDSKASQTATCKPAWLTIAVSPLIPHNLFVLFLFWFTFQITSEMCPLSLWLLFVRIRWWEHTWSSSCLLASLPLPSPLHFPHPAFSQADTELIVQPRLALNLQGRSCQSPACQDSRLQLPCLAFPRPLILTCCHRPSAHPTSRISRSSSINVLYSVSVWITSVHRREPSLS